ncbi:MAG: hypothetical protein AAGG09_20185 [Pseudomonadota bacterium]
MKVAALCAIAGAVALHGWLDWRTQRYAFAILDETSLVRMNTMTGDFDICGVRGAFLSADRTIVCSDE